MNVCMKITIEIPMNITVKITIQVRMNTATEHNYLIEDCKYDSDLGEISLRRIRSESLTFDIVD